MMSTAAAPQREIMATKIGNRLRYLQGRNPHFYEFAFHTLGQAELEPCLTWECYREHAIVQQHHILEQAAALEKEPLSVEEKFMQKLELQNQLDAERRAARPWLSLSLNERVSITSRSDGVAPPEPVRLLSELSPDDLFRLRFSRRQERVELVVDRSKSPETLAQSFKRLLERLHRTPGSKFSRTQVEDKRGHRPSVRERLFRLAVWRCGKAGLRPKQIRSLLDPLFPKFGPAPETFLKKCAAFVREAELMLLDRHF
jgi:hypothetical protein